MDVLELPRPVINFLRTMAKEGCRYVLSWDIFGGTDAVTLTLTWKLNYEQSQLSISKSSQQPIYDDLHIQNDESISSPHRSRQDENLMTKSALFRSSRGRSLEDHHSHSISPSKYKTVHSSQLPSLERSFITHRQKKESDPIYANISNVKSSLRPLSSSSCNYHPPISLPHTYHPQQFKQSYETTSIRKTTPSTPSINATPSKLKSNHHRTTRNDLNNDTLDPWVKRFECSLEDNINDSIDTYEDDTNRTSTAPGKVKFKRAPDYF